MEIVEEEVGANEQLKTSDYSSGNSETSSDSCSDVSVLYLIIFQLEANNGFNNVMSSLHVCRPLCLTTS